MLWANEQTNKIKRTEQRTQKQSYINIYSQLIINKETKAIQWGKDIFQQMMLEQYSHMHKTNNNMDTDFMPFTNITSKWITDLTVKCRTIKFLKGNIKPICSWVQ